MIDIRLNSLPKIVIDVSMDIGESTFCRVLSKRTSISIRILGWWVILVFIIWLVSSLQELQNFCNLVCQYSLIILLILLWLWIFIEISSKYSSDIDCLLHFLHEDVFSTKNLNKNLGKEVYIESSIKSGGRSGIVQYLVPSWRIFIMCRSASWTSCCSDPFRRGIAFLPLENQERIICRFLFLLCNW
jgi:hypothetical protein